MNEHQLPIFYSFRRCPYAIRARLAIKASGIAVELREVVLAEKPDELLYISPKATVPVLQLTDGKVIDESVDIMQWALQKNDPQYFLSADVNEINNLIGINDNDFKQNLDRYKYADRFPEHSCEYYREQCEGFLQQLEYRLSNSLYLISNEISMADIAIFPFIRQFAFVDKRWFDESEYKKLNEWLTKMLESELFNEVMIKYPQWQPGVEDVVF